MSDQTAYSLDTSSTHPSHARPASKTQHSAGQAEATGEHPSSLEPDPTATTAHPKPHSRTSNIAQDARKGGLTTSPSTSPAELSHLKVILRSSLRQFPDFPSPGILFEDIMPLFSSPSLHEQLITALELQIAEVFQTTTGEKSDIDVIVGLESRGFLFGPTLALRLGAGFVPVRKKGKLPGPCETESFEKEYGADHFQMQSDAIQSGQKVVVVDDIIATGGSAAAAGKLVRKLGGNLLGYVFMMELDFLKGRTKLDAHVHTLFAGQEEALKSQ